MQSINPNFVAKEDKFSTLIEVSAALKLAGLEFSNLVFAIDYTMSNHQQGQRSFNGKCLHTIEHGVLNPYQVIHHLLLIVAFFYLSPP
jgi:hypothetical protein